MTSFMAAPAQLLPGAGMVQMSEARVWALSWASVEAGVEDVGIASAEAARMRSERMYIVDEVVIVYENMCMLSYTRRADLVW